MKKFFFSVAALAAAISFTACSSEDVLVNGSEGVEPGSTGYMAFTINLPKDNGARVNDNFDEGEEAEYKVFDATLVLFDGEDQATAKFHSAYSLDVNGVGEVWGSPNNGGNVTVDNKYITKVVGTPAKPKAFVVLNGNGIIKADPITNGLYVNGENFPQGHTFADFQAMTKSGLDLNASQFTGNGILMMNAHLWSAGGETMNPTTDNAKGHILSTVNADNIYKTKEEASAANAQATSVYVERAVAKVTVKSEGNIAVNTVPFKAELKGWSLDNTNKSSYLVRSIEDFDTWASYKTNNKYRMVGYNTVGHQAAISQGAAGHNGYRTYFAKDTNYGADVTYGTETNKLTFANNAYAALKDMGTSAYCAENTFDVERMTYGNTTRVVLKAQITPAAGQPAYNGGFYSKPGSDTFFTEEQMGNLLVAFVNSEIAKLKDAGKLEGEGTITYTATPATDDNTQFTIKANVPATVLPTTTMTEEEKTTFNTLKGTGTNYSVHKIGYDFYEGGVSYYDARIQHFGEDHTPWTPHVAATINEAYGTAADREQTYLGRWGVLRNNWYELNVNKVTKIGYAHPWNLSFDPTDNPDDPNTPPYNPGTPDDNKESELWISVDVNILSWAKRFQNVEL